MLNISNVFTSPSFGSYDNLALDFVDPPTWICVKFLPIGDDVVDDDPFGNGPIYMVFAVLLCWYCNSYIFSRIYEGVDGSSATFT